MSKATATRRDPKEYATPGALNAPATAINRRVDSVDVIDARAIDSGNGGFDGYFATFGTLNSHNEILLAGAYDECVPQMLRDGFVCLDHDWAVDNHVGMINASTRDNKGQRATIAFHSDEKSQRARTRSAERLASDKTVKLSYAFTVDADGYTIVSGRDALKHLGPFATTEERARCAKLASVTIIHRVARVYEISIVALPSESHADVLQVRDGIETREHDADCALPGLDRDVTFSALIGVLDALYFNAICKALYWERDSWSKDEKVAHVVKSFTEAVPIVERAMNGILSDDDADAIDDAYDDLRAAFGVSDMETATQESIAASRAGVRYERQVEALRADAAAVIERTRDIHITKRNRRKLTTERDAMLTGLAQDLDTFAASVRGVIEATKQERSASDDSPIVDASARLRALRMEYVRMNAA